jgi:hypothetical protein
MKNWLNELGAIAEEMMSGPKVTVSVAAATTSAGVASLADIMSGALSWAALAAGLIATILLSRVHFIRYKNEVLQNKIFRAQLRELGGDPDKDEA